MKSIHILLVLSFFLTNQLAFSAGELNQKINPTKISKSAKEKYFHKMKKTLDLHVDTFNASRTDTNKVLDYFSLDDHEALKNLIKKHQIKSFPEIIQNDGEYIYKITNDHWMTFTLMDLKNYQVKINNQVIKIDQLSSLAQMTKAAESALQNKSSFFNIIEQIIGIQEANAGGLFGVAVITVVGVGFAAQYVSSMFEPDFEEADALTENYKRIKEIADLCEANKQGLLANLQQGVTRNNSLIHHLLWRTQDWGYDDEELIEAMSGDFASSCQEYGEKVANGIVSKNDRTMTGRDYTAKRQWIINKFDCKDHSISVGPGGNKDAYMAKKEGIIACVKSNCDREVLRHESCLKDLHGHINKNTREQNSEKVQQNYGVDWQTPINRRTLDMD